MQKHHNLFYLIENFNNFFLEFHAIDNIRKVLIVLNILLI